MQCKIYWKLDVQNGFMKIKLEPANPYDKTRKVYNPHFGETTYPHIHHIIIKFYENTGIVDSIQIVYDENGL